MRSAEKSVGMAYLLWLLSICGWLGFHRFYLGRTGSAILWILTLGIVGFGAVADLFLIPEMVSQANRATRSEEELDVLRTAALSALGREKKEKKAKKVTKGEQHA